MGIRYLQPRSHNRSDRVELFMRLWDRPLSDEEMQRLGEAAPISQIRSDFGNLNNTGAPFPADSCLASRFHPDFVSVIEPGVKELLLTIAIDHNLVTYTSCEGHDYRANEREPDERHVGVIPRDEAEMERAVKTFEAVGEQINRALEASSVEATLMAHTVSDGNRVYPALDLYLSKKAQAQWDDYFAQIDDAAERLTVLLREAEPIA